MAVAWLKGKNEHPDLDQNPGAGANRQWAVISSLTWQRDWATMRRRPRRVAVVAGDARMENARLAPEIWIG
jgi:hypothetical protein